MGRSSKVRSLEAVEAEVKRAEEALKKSKAKYDADKQALKDALDKRDALRNEELIKAIAQSKHSYEEILQYLRGEESEAE